MTPSALGRRGWRSALAASLSVVAMVGVGGCGGGEDPVASSSPATEASSLPAEFVGIVAPEVLPASDYDVNAALDAQAKAGITVFRQPFRWDEIEPRKGTFNFAMYDRLVGTAAKHGITILPIVFGVRAGEGAPEEPGAKITGTTTMPPRSPERFAAFAATLVERYGRDGTYWADHPKVPAMPVTAWQVWNEPNLPAYWGGKVDPAGYATLLEATAAKIRAADPEAEVVTGGLPDSKIGTPLLEYVREMTRAGAAGSYDTLAVHPYALTADAVLDGARSARLAAVQAGARDDVKVWITEIGWATGGPGSSFTVTEAKQAELVSEIFRDAAARRDDLHLRGVVYYAWRDSPVPPGGQDFWGLYTGLVSRDNQVKPSLSAFSSTVQALEQ